MDTTLLAQISLSGQAADFAADALQRSQAIHQAIDSLWTSIPQGGTYQGLCLVGANIAVAALIFWGYNWYKQILENGFAWEQIIGMFWPLICILLLVSSPGDHSGRNLWSLTNSIRSFIDNADQAVLSSVVNSTNLATARSQAGQNLFLDAQVKQIFKQCAATPSPDARQACINQNRAQINQWIAGNTGGSSNWGQSIANTANQLFNAAANYDPAQIPGDLANLYENAFVSILQAFVLAIGVAFSYLLNLALLLTAILGPIAVGASLLPLPTKPILAWLTTMFSLGTAQISYDIITGLMSDIMNNAPPENAMPYIIFTGILAPILALSIAMGGGIATFSGLVNVAGSATFVGARSVASTVTSLRSSRAPSVP